MMKVLQNSLPLHSKRTYWLRWLSKSLNHVHSRVPLSSRAPTQCLQGAQSSLQVSSCPVSQETP